MPVECPRCANFLPEPPGYGSYKCNHCGFVFKGMKNVPTHYGGSSENRPKVELGNYGEDGNGRNDEILRYIAPGLMNKSSKTSTRGNRDASFDIYGSRRHGGGGSRLEMDAIYRENGGGLRYREPQDPIHHPLAPDDINVVYGYGSHDSSFEQGFGDNSPQLEGFARRDVGGDRFERNSRNPGLFREQQRPLDYGYLDEGPSYYEPPSSFGYGRPVDNYDDVPRPYRGLEDERADLLMQLEDLKTWIARTYDMPYQTGREVPVNRNWAPVDPYRGRAGVSYNHPEDVRLQGPPYMNPGHDHIPFPSNYDTETQNYYQGPRHLPGTFNEYEDPVRSQMSRRPANYAAKVSSHGTILDDNWDTGQDRKVSYQHDPFLLEAPPRALPNVPGSTKIADDSFHARPNQVGPTRTNQAGNGVATLDDLESQPQKRRPINYSSDHATHGSGSHTPESAVDALRNKKHYQAILAAATLDNLDTQVQSRRSSPIGSEHSSHGSRRHPPDRMVVTTEKKKHDNPISGASPFILCLDCCEVLKIPKELSFERKSRQKLKCGACSSIILIVVKNRSLIPSMWKEPSSETNKGIEPSSETNKGIEPSSETNKGIEPSSETNKGPLDIPNKDVSASCRSSNASETKCDGIVDTKETCSSHNDDSNNIECEKSEDDDMLEDHQVDTSESNNKQVIHSSSSSSSSFSSNEEDSQNHVIIQRNILTSMELPLEEPEPEPEPDSPLHEQFDHFSISEIEPAEDNIGHDKNYENASSISGSYKDVSGPTEVSISASEYPNTNVSNDSVEVSKEEKLSKKAKESKSYFGGFFKMSIRGFLEPNHVVEKEGPKVTVNGHPISDDELRRAQMLAGPIQPGNYWYDYRAGFWGVVNTPCLGIIPPGIEEFKYSMPPNCAAGNTGVYVNGRELNTRDLNLLASRGLPTTTDKFYTIGISGKVQDEETGEQLYGLGKLAPTVQRAKQGFGMRVPRFS